MSNFFKGLKKFNNRLFSVAIIINIIWYYLSMNESLNVSYAEVFIDMEIVKIKEDFLWLSTFAIIISLFIVNFFISSFIVGSNEEKRNSDRLIRIESNINHSMKRIDSKLNELQTDIDKIKERQLAPEVKNPNTSDE